MSKAGTIRGMAVRAWTLALAVFALGTALSSTAQALPANFWGIDPQAPPSLDQLQRIKRGGVSSIRISIPWGAIQTTPDGPPNWSSVDPVVKIASQAGVEVLPFVYGAPSWAVAVAKFPSTNPPATLPVKTGAQRFAWTSFLKLVVARYGPNGSFWAENPDISPRPIRTWQIWNEENFFYFVAKPSPGDYGKLVKISHQAIKSVDPGAKILLGGMFALPNPKVSPGSYPAYKFLSLMYKRTPGVKNYFDGVTLHPYVRDYWYLTPEIEQVRAALKSSGDAGVPLWITELGWSSGKPTHSNLFAKGPQGQVKQLKGAFALLSKNQRKWRIQRVYWFSLDDAPGNCNFCDGSGLFGAGFIPKPAWNAFVKFTGGSAR
jgi:polysaccharide biosynthesis protein PslG